MAFLGVGALEHPMAYGLPEHGYRWTYFMAASSASVFDGASQQLYRKSISLIVISEKPYGQMHTKGLISQAISPSIGIVLIMSFSWIVDKKGRNAILPVIAVACGIHFVSKFAWILYDTTSFEYKW
jgi:dTDP-4-dehydrorhamnose reductase